MNHPGIGKRVRGFEKLESKNVPECVREKHTTEFPEESESSGWRRVWYDARTYTYIATNSGGDLLADYWIAAGDVQHQT